MMISRDRYIKYNFIVESWVGWAGGADLVLASEQVWFANFCFVSGYCCTMELVVIDTVIQEIQVWSQDHRADFVESLGMILYYLYLILTHPIVLFSNLLSARVALVLQPLLLLPAQAQRLIVRKRVLPHALVATHSDKAPCMALDLQNRPHLVTVGATDQITAGGSLKT